MHWLHRGCIEGCMMRCRMNAKREPTQLWQLQSDYSAERGGEEGRSDVMKQ